MHLETVCKPTAVKRCILSRDMLQYDKNPPVNPCAVALSKLIGESLGKTTMKQLRTTKREC